MGNKQNTNSQIQAPEKTQSPATVLKEKKETVNVQQVKETKIRNILDRNHFDFLHVIGKGGFGKVNKIKSFTSLKNYIYNFFNFNIYYFLINFFSSGVESLLQKK